MAEVWALRISSEEEAWAYLQRALEGDLPEDLVPEVQFSGWPVVEVYIPATPVQSSISPAMMQAFIDLQTAIYRSHALLTTGDRSSRTLSKAERERLEFRVKVEGGSSAYKVDLTHIADTLGVAAIGKMTPEQVLIAILGLALIVGGTVAWGMYLKHRTEVRKAEAEERGKQYVFDAFAALTEADTKRQQMWLEAQKVVPALAPVREEQDAVRAEILKAVSEEGVSAVVNGLRIEPDVANDLVSTSRRKLEESRLRSIFRVARVDTTVPDGFRVSLRDVKTGDELNASLQDALISDEHRRRIRVAEWEKRPVFVELAVRRSRTRVVEAVIIDVQDATQERSAR